MLTVVTYWWGDKYGPEYVDRLRGGFARNLQQRHRFIVVTDRPGRTKPPNIQFYVMHDEDRHLCAIKGCFARLRLFDPDFQKHLELEDRLLVADLDAVVVNMMDPLVDREEPFSIVQGINTSNLCPFNGSLWMLRTGYRPDVWSDFSVDAYKARGVPFHEFPDDQGWLYHKIPGAAAYGANEGVYGFKKKHWPPGDGLPLGARFVCFPGWRDPSRFVDSVPWIRKHWRE